jgi:hypothetical protein
MNKQVRNILGVGLLMMAGAGCGADAPHPDALSTGSQTLTAEWRELSPGLWERTVDGATEWYGSREGAAVLARKLAAELETLHRASERDTARIEYIQGVLQDIENRREASSNDFTTAAGSCSPSASASPLSPGASASASINCSTAQGLTTRAYVQAGGQSRTYTGATYGTSSWANGWLSGGGSCYAEGYASSASGWWSKRWYSGCYW